MKLTWFGGTALRAYIGGEIVVVDPDAAADRVDRGELMAGADRVLTLDDPAIPTIDPMVWRPKPVGRAMDEVPPLDIFRIGDKALLIDGSGELPLVLLADGALPRLGRWVGGALIVLLSSRWGRVNELSALLDVARPRMIALAIAEETVDRIVVNATEHLDGAGLVSMELGLALEV